MGEECYLCIVGGGGRQDECRWAKMFKTDESISYDPIHTKRSKMCRDRKRMKGVSGLSGSGVPVEGSRFLWYDRSPLRPCGEAGTTL